MIEEAKKFLNDERDLSEYKIELLSSGKERAYTSRLISIELEYSQYPFQDLGLTSKVDMKDAMALFRVDKSAFLKKYKTKDESDDARATSLQISSLEKKISHIESVHKWLINTKIKAINLVDDEYFSEKYDTSSQITSYSDLKGTPEGAICAKERARVQILVCCLSRCLYKEAAEVRLAMATKTVSKRDFFTFQKMLDTAFSRSAKKVFRFYNDSIGHAAVATDNSVGENRFLPTIYPLLNIFDEQVEPLLLERKLSLDRDVLTKTGRPIKKKFVERAYSIRTPIGRVGSESLGLLYFNLFSDAGVCLDPIMDESFYNIGYKGSYYKAISTIPLWQIEKMDLNPYLQREYYKLVGISDEPLLDGILSNNTNVIDKINNSKCAIRINSDLSRVLIAATRTESDRLFEAKMYMDILINGLKKEYQSVFAIRSDSSSEENRKNRKSKVKDIIRSIF